ncbi:hypothetical protein KUV44_05130 [Marinobacter daepoensis]|uniref:Uncharacterized protein n=1 Tax=Marinobacter daepoensis TaxID=262077 RepID=A0ABS3BHY0_9GAMM|nr:hypothetical protein [Marinobacter daepoensis]MBN7769820.1 hypothetical protein [Marinobacter daepoensis]MBY6078510.1 hypothetical protein [Marinobacter daepoensis]
MDLFSDFSVDASAQPTIFGKCASPRKSFDFDIKSCLERYWSIYENHAERNFLPGLMGAEFRQRWWEMYLWGRLTEMGFSLSQPKDGMPDICIRYDKKVIYLECVSPTPGVGINKIKESPEEKIFDVPEDEIILRLTSAIEDKNKQAKGRKERVGSSHYIIAIDVSQLAPFGLDELSVIKSLFPVGDESITISNNGRFVSRRFSFRNSVKKKSGVEIETARFLGNKEYSQISGILFCDARFENVAAGAKPELCIIHNYHAAKYLSRKIFRGERQWESNGYNALYCRD